MFLCKISFYCFLLSIYQVHCAKQCGTREGRLPGRSSTISTKYIFNGSHSPVLNMSSQSSAEYYEKISISLQVSLMEHNDGETNSLESFQAQSTINNLLHPRHFFEFQNCHFDETYFRVSSIGGSQVMWRVCHWTVSLSRQMWKKKDSGIITLFLNKGTLPMSLSCNINIFHCPH